MSKYFGTTPVSRQIPFDNTTTNAAGLNSTDEQSVIEELWQKVKGASGVTPPFFFGRVSGGGAGTYLTINGLATNKVGQIVRGLNTLVGMTVTTSANISGANAVVQLQQRTALNTFVDISGASITIPIGTYSATAVLAVALPSNVEISAYIKSGTTSDINLQVYVAAT